MSQKLFHLVKSLSPSEKRYFKLLAAMQGKQSNYVLILDAIARQKAYDEAKLIRKFRDEPFVKHFSVTKNYLYNLILKSLSIYYGNTDPEGKILDGIKTIKALLYKGKVGDALKNWEKVFDQAKQLERYELQLVLLSLEEALQSSHLTENELELFREEWQEKYFFIQKVISQKYRVKRLWEKFRKAYIKNITDTKERHLELLKTFINHESIANIDDLYSSDARHHYYMIHIVMAIKEDDLSRANHIAYQQLSWIEEAAQVLNFRPKIYYTAIHAYLRTQIGIGQLTDFDSYLAKLEAMPQTHDKLLNYQNLADLFCFKYNAILLKNHQQQEAMKTIQLVDDFNRGFARYQSAMDQILAGQILFGFLHALFEARRWEECIDWFERVLSVAKGGPYATIVVSAKFIKIIAHFELGHIKLSKSLIRNFKRKYFTEEHHHPVFQLVLEHIAKIINIQDQEQNHRSIYISLREALHHKSGDPRQRKYIYFIDLLRWVGDKC